MAQIPWKFVVKDVDRYGKVRWYFRRKGKPKVKLEGEPGEEPFALAYFAARDGTPIQKPGKKGARPGTFRYIVDRYLVSHEFKALDIESTQPARERLLLKLVESIGDKPAVIDPMTIRLSLKTRKNAAGKELLTALKGLYKFAIDEGLVQANPTLGVTHTRDKTDGFRTWTREDCEAFEKTWAHGTQARTAYAIGLYTAQRISDAIRIGRPHERNGWLTFTQKKNGKKNPVTVSIPIVPPLRRALNAWQGKGLTWLENGNGEPHSNEEMFRRKFRVWCQKAGVHPKCTFHGLRKAAAARMAETGCTPHQIMAVLGHTTHQQAATYTAKVNRAGLASDALKTLWGEQDVQPRQSDWTLELETEEKTTPAKRNWQSLGESNDARKNK